MNVLMIFQLASLIATANATLKPQSIPTDSKRTSKPNIVFLLADDLDYDSLKYFPNINKLLVNEGMVFQNTFVTNSLCCPSRASILRGQYPHNTKVTANGNGVGGFEAFYHSGDEASTIATWLQSAGYKTQLVGKYLNNYPMKENQTYVPTGWSDWFGASGFKFWTEYNYPVIDNGFVRHFGERDDDYFDDVISKRVTSFIDQNANNPFYIYYSAAAPHQPATPARRHLSRFLDQKAPRDGSFNELDVSDKPQWIKKLPLLTMKDKRAIDKLYIKRLQSMLAIDEFVGNLISQLTEKGILDQTYIVFTSDNGFHLGQHRKRSGKEAAYETDIHIPFVIRGPNIQKQSVNQDLILNQDFAPTFAELADVDVPTFIDGRSFANTLTGKSLESSRRQFLIEHLEGTERGHADIPDYNAIRTNRYKYVYYPKSNEEELYDLESDPYEMNSLHREAKLTSLKNQLHADMQKLTKCSAESCWSIENKGQPRN